MSVTWPVGVQEGRLDQADVDLLVAPFFQDHRPLRGPAARVDWRLCGLLSEQLAPGRATGARGDAVLLATAGRFRAPCALAYGLGPRPGFSARDLRRCAVDLLGRLAALRVGRVALALGDENLFGFPVEVATIAWLEGMAEGLLQRPAAFALHLLAPDPKAVVHGIRQASERLPSGVRLRPLGSREAPDRSAAPGVMPPRPALAAALRPTA